MEEGSISPHLESGQGAGKTMWLFWPIEYAGSEAVPASGYAGLTACTSCLLKVNIRLRSMTTLRTPSCEKSKPCREIPESETPQKGREIERGHALGGRSQCGSGPPIPAVPAKAMWWEIHHPASQATKFLTIYIISEIKWWLQVTKLQGSLLNSQQQPGVPPRDRRLWWMYSHLPQLRSQNPGSHDVTLEARQRQILLWGFWPVLGKTPKATHLRAPHSHLTEKLLCRGIPPTDSLQSPFSPLP